MSDILSQEEIDALLHGVDNGEIESIVEEVVIDGEARSYDFTSQDRIVRGRLPTLEMINDRFSRYFRNSLFELLQRAPEISVGGVQLLKYSEYIHSLFVPASMNIVKLRPLRGSALFTLDARLVFAIVDNFFGGSGRFHNKIEGREFTPTETRVVDMVLERVFRDLEQAWSPVFALTCEQSGAEVNPQFANIVSATEVVVVTVFNTELEGGGGELHLAMPYSMLEPIRELLDSPNHQGEQVDSDETWVHALSQEVFSANVEMNCTLARTELSVGDIVGLESGDVIPIELPANAVARVDEVPLLRGRFGVSGGNLALKVTEFVSPPTGAIDQRPQETD
ncbi:MAG: flagellar motor switch protein FliM [Gammaproteobacteria bacterium]|nr:flagellar motor switch protein FliM [Gammaproteobacteria bacterium]